MGLPTCLAEAILKYLSIRIYFSCFLQKKIKKNTYTQEEYQHFSRQLMLLRLSDRECSYDYSAYSFFFLLLTHVMSMEIGGLKHNYYVTYREGDRKTVTIGRLAFSLISRFDFPYCVMSVYCACVSW